MEVSTGERLQKALRASQKPILSMVGRQTKDKLAAQRHSTDVGRRVWAISKRLEHQLIDAELMPDD